jgi:hypothetical protein
VLYAQNFDAADGTSADYPPLDGTHRSLVDGRVAGWASGGVVRLSYLPAVGVNRTGGLLVTPAEGAEDTVYYLASINPIPFAGRSGATLPIEDVRALRLTFALRLPPGRKVNCSLSLIGTTELDQETWTHRLSPPSIVGDGAFAPVAISGKDFPEEAVAGFLATARKLGDRRLRLALQWYLIDAANWTPGETAALDDIRLTLER